MDNSEVVAMKCESCGESLLCYTENVCPKCRGAVVLANVNKPKRAKRKSGRPITRSRKQRKEKDAQWFIDNAEKRKKYQHEYYLKRQKAKFGCRVKVIVKN